MASGNSLFTCLPQDNEPPASAYAQLDTRNSALVLAFDAATQEGAVFGGVLPSHYAGGGLTLDLFWYAASATSGDVVWDAAYEEGGSDIDADNFGTVGTATTTTNGTSGIETKSTITISHANMGSPAAGSTFRLRVRRLAADGADTMTGDSHFIAAHGKES